MNKRSFMITLSILILTTSRLGAIENVKPTESFIKFEDALELNQELQSKVLQDLSAHDLRNLTLTSKIWNRICQPVLKKLRTNFGDKFPHNEKLGLPLAEILIQPGHNISMNDLKDITNIKKNDSKEISKIKEYYKELLKPVFTQYRLFSEKLENNGTELHIVWSSLEFIFPAVFQDAKFKNLTELNLVGLSLKRLPNSVGSLKKLIKLNLENNMLTNLPDSIKNLTKLTILNLESNDLTRLPNNIGTLKNLRELNLTDNELTRLTDKIGHLTKLTILDLRHNKLTNLHDSIGNLTKLTDLDLYGHKLSDKEKVKIRNMMPTSTNIYF